MDSIYSIGAAVFLVHVFRGFAPFGDASAYEEARSRDLEWTHMSSSGFTMIASEDGLEINAGKPKIWVDDHGFHEVRPDADHAERCANYLKQANSAAYKRLFFLEFTTWQIILPTLIWTLIITFVLSVLGAI